MDLYERVNCAGFLKKDTSASTGYSRRVCIQSDHQDSTMPFMIAFNLAAKASKYGETPLVICKRNKCGFGSLPPVLMDEMTAEGLDHYRKNQSRKDGDWDLNTLSKIKVQHAETLEELLTFLCSVHKWKKDVPSLVVIDDIASLLSGSNRSYQEMLGIVSHIQNALLSLSDELRDEASQALKASSAIDDIHDARNDVSENNLPSILLRRRALESSEVAVILSESSQNAQICDHLKEKLHLGVNLNVAALERNANLAVIAKAEVTFSPFHGCWRNKKRSRATGPAQGNTESKPLYLELEQHSLYSMRS